MSISASAISETLDYAFRAAFLLTGRADLAENAVLNGIAGLDSNDDVEKALVPKTIEFVIRQRTDLPNQLEHALARLPHELQRLILLAPVPRDCFLLRVLFGIPVANCATILNLTIEEFEESLCAAFQQLSMLGRSERLLRFYTSTSRLTSHALLLPRRLRRPPGTRMEQSPS
jgi:hypothetical protein